MMTLSEYWKYISFIFYSFIISQFSNNIFYSIEDDFITWKDKFWPAVCEFFGIEGAGEDVNIRQYKLTEHVDLSIDRIYTGEIARLHSFQVQRA